MAENEYLLEFENGLKIDPIIIFKLMSIKLKNSILQGFTHKLWRILVVISKSAYKEHSTI